MTAAQPIYVEVDRDPPAWAPPRRRGPAARLLAFLAAFPVVCFTLALLTDLAYWSTLNLTWSYFSSWLLFAGLVAGGFALLGGAIALLVGRRRGWGHLAIFAVALGLAFVNSLVHARDGWAGVWPWGLALSAATVLVLLIGGLLPGPSFLDGERRHYAEGGRR